MREDGGMLIKKQNGYSQSHKKQAFHFYFIFLAYSPKKQGLHSTFIICSPVCFEPLSLFEPSWSEVPENTHLHREEWWCQSCAEGSAEGWARHLLHPEEATHKEDLGKCWSALSDWASLAALRVLCW